MKKAIIFLALFFSIILLRESSKIDEFQARDIALEIISLKHSNLYCGGDFERYLILDKEHPLSLSQVVGIDKAGYTFRSNNGRCTLEVFIYKYWGGYLYQPPG